MKESYLFQCGYEKSSENTYEKIDKKSGMRAVLVFNKNGTTEQNRIIDQQIIEISTRQDI